VLPSSKDSTPESQVLAASFSCRLLMISWSSEPELFWKKSRKTRRERERGDDRWLEDRNTTSKRRFDLRRLSRGNN